MGSAFQPGAMVVMGGLVSGSALEQDVARFSGISDGDPNSITHAEALGYISYLERMVPNTHPTKEESLRIAKQLLQATMFTGKVDLYRDPQASHPDEKIQRFEWSGDQEEKPSFLLPATLAFDLDSLKQQREQEREQGRNGKSRPFPSVSKPIEPFPINASKENRNRDGNGRAFPSQNSVPSPQLDRLIQYEAWNRPSRGRRHWAYIH